MKPYILSFLIIFCLISGTGNLINPEVVQMEQLDTLQPQEFPIPPENLGIDKREYPILAPHNFFWVGDHLVEYLGEGFGTLITPPVGEPFTLPSSEGLKKFNDSTIVLVYEWYGLNENQSDTHYTSLYHVPTGTMTTLDPEFGDLRKVVTGEGLLFENQHTSVATYYLVNTGTSHSYDYSNLVNSTHQAYVSGIANGHVIINSRERGDSYFTYFSINIITHENHTIVEDLQYPDIGYDEVDSNSVYLCDSYNNHLRCVRYDAATKTSTTHIFENADNDNVRANFQGYFGGPVNGWITGTASGMNIFYTHDWDSNTTTYYTNDASISKVGVNLMSGLSWTISEDDWLNEVFMHNSTHAYVIYDNSAYKTTSVAIFGLVTEIIHNDITFDGRGWLSKDAVLDIYYYDSMGEDALSSTGDRYCTDPSFNEITTLPNVFTTVDNLGLPYVGWANPQMVFDFPQLNRTVFIINGEDDDLIMIYEGTDLLMTLPVPTYSFAGIEDGNNLYMGSSNSIYLLDVAALTAPVLIYNIAGPEEIQYRSKLHIYDGSLVFFTYDYSASKLYISELLLSDYSYTCQDYGLNYHWDTYDPSVTSFYDDWAAVFYESTNITIINFRTGENDSYVISPMYQTYAGSQWIFDSYDINIEFLPGFDLTDGEIMMKLSMYENYDNNYAAESSDLIILSADGTLSDASKYGFPDGRLAYSSYLTSNLNSSQILLGVPTPSGSDLYLLYFNADLSWEMISLSTPDNLALEYKGLHITPNGFVAKSRLSGIIIHNFYEILEEIPPEISNIFHTADPDPTTDIEIRVDALDPDSGVDYVSLIYRFDGHDNASVTMNPIGNGTWTYTVSAINDAASTFFEFQITAVDLVGNEVETERYTVDIIIIDTSDTVDTDTPSTTTTDTTTSDTDTTTSAPVDDTSDSDTTDTPVSLVMILVPLVAIPILLRKINR